MFASPAGREAAHAKRQGKLHGYIQTLTSSNWTALHAYNLARLVRKKLAAWTAGQAESQTQLQKMILYSIAVRPAGKQLHRHFKRLWNVFRNAVSGPSRMLVRAILMWSVERWRRIRQNQTTAPALCMQNQWSHRCFSFTAVRSIYMIRNSAIGCCDHRHT